MSKIRWDDVITVVCYGKKKQMVRKKAKAFYAEAILNSEGAEQDRYTNIYIDIIEGQMICSDIAD